MNVICWLNGRFNIIDCLSIIKFLKFNRSLVVEYFNIYESDLVRERKARRLKRCRFWAAGVNDMIAVDQHDKWKRFGLAFHIGEDPFCGVIQWLRVWHNNNNPKLVLSYYLDWAEDFGCEFNFSRYFNTLKTN